MDTTLTIDLGAIISAITALIVAIAGVMATKVALEIRETTQHTRVLVNDQMTREKANRLLEMQTSRELLAITIGHTISDSQKVLLANMDKQIKSLTAEIRQRDIAAGTLSQENDRRQRYVRGEGSPDGTR